MSNRKLTVSAYITGVVLLLLFVIAPGVTGLMVKNELDILITSLNRQGVPVKLEQYQRHWFTSKAILKFAGMSHEQDVSILHGPIIWDKGIQLGLLKLNSSLNLMNFSNKLNLRISLLGSVEIKTTSKNTSKMPFVPGSVTTTIKIPKISNATHSNASIVAKNIFLSPDLSESSLLKSINLKLNLHHIDGKRWKVTSSTRLSDFKYASSLIAGKASFQSLSFNNIVFFPRNVGNMVFNYSQMRASHIQKNLFETIIPQLVTNKTNIELKKFNFDSQDTGQASMLKGTLNFKLSWPTLPVDVKKITDASDAISRLGDLISHLKTNIILTDARYVDDAGSRRRYTSRRERHDMGIKIGRAHV